MPPHFLITNFNPMAKSILVSFTLLFCLSHQVLAQVLKWEAVANPLNHTVNGVVFTKDGSQLIAGTNCHPAKIRMFDAQDGKLKWDFTLSEDLMCVMGVGLSANEKYLTAIEEFGNLMVFDYTQNPPDSINTIDIGTEHAFSTAFSPNSEDIAVGGSSGKLVICNVETGAVVKSVPAHLDWVTTVAYSPDGKWIATGGSDSRVKIWSSNGELENTFTSHKRHITKVRFSKDGSRLYSSSQDNTLIIWDLRKKLQGMLIEVSEADVNDFVLSPDESKILTISDDGIMKLWSNTDFSLLKEITVSTEHRPICVDWSSDNTRIAVGLNNGMVNGYSVWEVLSSPQSDNGRRIKMYPTLVDAQMHVECEICSAIEVYSSQGQKVHAETFSASSEIHSLNLNHLAKGVYQVRLFGDKKQWHTTRRIIKN